MNKEQHKLLDDTYENYQTEWLKENPPFSGPYTDKCLTQEEFIDKCKTDDEFANKWGLKIEERELSLKERTDYKKKRDGIARTIAPYSHQILDNSNIPTKLITITYNDKTIESYE
jgi:hypothetical protein